MIFLIPYNEILPTKRAHDFFLFKEAVTLANCGHDVHLVCGRGTPDDETLYKHYGKKGSLTIHRLPIIRKNNPFGVSWNRPFFAACQTLIQKIKPDRVLLSVLKQAAYHLDRRVKGVKYIYEAHEISAYPSQPRGKLYDKEKMMMMQADQIVVTTNQLKTLLKTAPYNLKTPIKTIPLATDFSPLSPYDGPPILTYVGQLYKEQGIADLIEAVKGESIDLRIVGGNKEEIALLDKNLPNVSFTGFVAPQDLRGVIEETTAFVAPFHLTGRMPYVAHTKLDEYAAWGRPIIAPNTPVVTEHFTRGVLTYTSTEELKSCIQEISTFETLPPPPLSWEERVSQLVK
ncbi:MAG: hypothetical protein S4CHLAM45_01430 [Chlamydiales bacterium]|nr:hypothetical protein [Chlamydiales bacterium]MCH9619463.1 hypothetical protein [Chlamydiales bacterium]MCH9622267.1 hypothetical protein [Chlamydiales bacterium]